MKDKNGNVFTGKVWPGVTAFPDFFHPDANTYWEKQVMRTGQSGQTSHYILFPFIMADFQFPQSPPC